MYMCPDGLSDALIDTMGQLDRVVPYFDIPWQHCSERVLRTMRRRGSRDHYSAIVMRIRDILPDAAIRGTFIVGHPGEDDAAFHELLEWLDAMQFDWVVAFPFSPEAGTAAADLDHVSAAVAQERYHRLMSAQQGISRNRAQAMVGRTMDVLLERRTSPRRGQGRTYRDAPEVDGVVDVKGVIGDPGRIYPVRITGCTAYSLQGIVDTDTGVPHNIRQDTQQDTNQEVA